MTFEDESKFLENEIMDIFKDKKMVDYFIKYGYADEVLKSGFRIWKFSQGWELSFKDYIPTLEKITAHFDSTIGKFIKNDNKEGLLKYIESSLNEDFDEHNSGYWNSKEIETYAIDYEDADKNSENDDNGENGDNSDSKHILSD